MTDIQIIDILDDLTKKRHKYSDAEYLFADDLSRMHKTLAMSYADTVEGAKHETPLRDNY